MADPTSYEELAGQYGGGGEQQAADEDNLFGVSDAIGNAPVLIGFGQPERTEGHQYVEQRPTAEVSRVLDLLQQLYTFSPDYLRGIQAQLLVGGFYGSTPPRFGVPDDETLKAWQKALVRAARSGASLWEVLDMRGAGGFTATPEQVDALLGNAKPERPGPVDRIYNMPDPALSGDAVEAAFQKALGRKPTKAEKASFVAEYESNVRSAQDVQFDAQDESNRRRFDAKTAQAAAPPAAQEPVDPNAPIPQPRERSRETGPASKPDVTAEAVPQPDGTVVPVRADVVMPDMGSNAEQYAEEADPLGHQAYSLVEQGGPMDAFFAMLFGGTEGMFR